MRKITILIATCILFIMPSCTKSNEDKAEELISKCIKENMSYPDSYEAISTKVDSSFVKVSTIIEILDLSEDVFSDISKIRAIKSDISSAQTTKEIYTPTGSASPRTPATWRAPVLAPPAVCIWWGLWPRRCTP